ncbi:type II toxin-antitoxin system HipA family toxin [Rhodohalobacter sp. SW132]|uniref:HipA domain-containing protein n=1 Tax=Rhodohalobacter sp. SW132 TaxID=2293433 RepID=UPI000E26364C|nr:HipA domain-containing protein [Rhodohalobacter sp. SW132]REL24825.1 type II toxin-antitoxin system HipA family toxin [Rhodohalobacter sp. SW132]
MSKCLICANRVPNGKQYHPKCLQKLFDSREKPVLEVNLDQLNELAKKSVHQRVTVPGVQTKLSLEEDRKTDSADKLTIVGLWGRYILKPPSSKWPELPANEHCTMMLAEAAGIETVPYGLIHLGSGELAYITKRIDRDDKGNKFAMEDMCQLTGRLTEDKYKGSHEQIAKTVKQFSANPLFDLTRFYELVLFSYLTGNGDMHLKNFSLFNDPAVGWKLAPGYDLLNTRLVIPKEKDPEELALTLTGKKRNFNPDSFHDFGLSIGLNPKQIQNINQNFLGKHDIFNQTIEKSFLSDGMKELYHLILAKRCDILV